MLLLSTLLVVAVARAHAPATPCEDRGTTVVVQTQAHTLTLCEKGVAMHHLRVSLGRGGVGKQRRGDEKTPIGTYKLGRPRPSHSGFGVFIPVGYPNAHDRAHGRTGSAIGIHGPPAGEDVISNLAAVDWTLGCIALATRADNQLVAQWVEQRLPLEMSIE